jgi:hypothetical protein
VRGCVREHRTDKRRTGHALRSEPRKLEQELRTPREADHDGALSGARIHDRQAIAGELKRPIPLWVPAAIRAAIAQAIHRQHPEMARKIRDLHLPMARMDQRPRRNQKNGLVAVAIDLVEQPLTVPIDEPLRIRITSPALLPPGARRKPGVRPASEIWRFKRMAARGQPVFRFLPCARGEAPVTAGPGDGMAAAARPTSGRSRPPAVNR